VNNKGQTTMSRNAIGNGGELMSEVNYRRNGMVRQVKLGMNLWDERSPL